MKIITLTTDFGYVDSFVGTIKGVILNIFPDVKIVDITHNISTYSVEQASYIIKSFYHYFPKGSIHNCIVDPGVGSQRKPIAIQTQDYFFVGPDNGLFTHIIENENVLTVVELTESKYWLNNVSKTFHGRDIFSPVAAYIAKGEPLTNLGEKTRKEELIKLNKDKLIKNQNGYIGVVQYIDHFGNIITNVPNHKIIGKVQGKLKEITFTGLVSNFSKGEPNKLHAIYGSNGYIELFINKGNAAKFIGAKIHDPIEFIFLG